MLRGPGRNPGASSNTRKRLSIYVSRSVNETIRTLTGKATDSMLTSEASTPAAAAMEATSAVSVSALYVSMPRSRDRPPLSRLLKMASLLWPLPRC